MASAKNTKQKGKKNRKGGGDIAQELLTKEDGQEYAQVTKLLGGCTLEAQCFDGKKRRCSIRGKMRNKVWIAVGDIVLVGLRDFQDGTADVIGKYTPEQASRLKKLGELPDNAVVKDDDAEAVEECPFEFDEI
jgi:translation initiation factor 1A